MTRWHWGTILIIEGLLLNSFNSEFERAGMYKTIWIIVIVLNLALFYIRKRFEDKDLIYKKVPLSYIIYSVVMVLVFTFSYFQFNYVVMPYDFFQSDVFYVNYDYNDLRDDVRIEYYARNYYEYGEVYKESYDKDEIQAFLEFFRDVEVTSDYQEAGSPNVFMDWENDIHVMIRNMDVGSDTGYYVFSIDLLDTSDYAVRIESELGIEIYKVSDELRLFIVKHLLEE